MLLDTRSDYNLIDYSFLDKNTKLEEFTDFPGLTAVSNLPIYTFSIYPLYIRTHNALGDKHLFVLRFVIADITPFTIILGQP
jgi:hypothetical protein